jgi:hypothetical protein
LTQNSDIKILKDKISYMIKMEAETVTLPRPTEGYEYVLRKKSPIRHKDPSELTPKQLSALKYREKNREKINEKKRLQYEKKKKENQ